LEKENKLLKANSKSDSVTIQQLEQQIKHLKITVDKDRQIFDGLLPELSHEQLLERFIVTTRVEKKTPKKDATGRVIRNEFKVDIETTSEFKITDVYSCLVGSQLHKQMGYGMKYPIVMKGLLGFTLEDGTPNISYNRDPWDIPDVQFIRNDQNHITSISYWTLINHFKNAKLGKELKEHVVLEALFRRLYNQQDPIYTKYSRQYGEPLMRVYDIIKEFDQRFITSFDQLSFPLYKANVDEWVNTAMTVFDKHHQCNRFMAMQQQKALDDYSRDVMIKLINQHYMKYHLDQVMPMSQMKLEIFDGFELEVAKLRIEEMQSNAEKKESKEDWLGIPFMDVPRMPWLHTPGMSPPLSVDSEVSKKRATSVAKRQRVQDSSEIWDEYFKTTTFTDVPPLPEWLEDAKLVMCA